MESDDEKLRLERVYQSYQTDEAVQARRSGANPGNRYNYLSWRRRLKRILAQAGAFPLDEQRFLEVGCGSGDVVAALIDWGAAAEKICGIDLRADCIEQARQRFPGVDFRHANAEVLDFEDATFDFVLLFTVFTSILDQAMAHNVAGEVRRVLKPGGSILWHDFRYDNPWNPHVRGVDRNEIRRLFPQFEMRLYRETLLPPLARRLGKLTPVLYPVFAAIPFLRTHWIGLLTKPA